LDILSKRRLVPVVFRRRRAPSPGLSASPAPELKEPRSFLDSCA
jgi:hypothetical protein